MLVRQKLYISLIFRMEINGCVFKDFNGDCAYGWTIHRGHASLSTITDHIPVPCEAEESYNWICFLQYKIVSIFMIKPLIQYSTQVIHSIVNLYKNTCSHMVPPWSQTLLIAKISWKFFFSASTIEYSFANSLNRSCTIVFFTIDPIFFSSTDITPDTLNQLMRDKIYYNCLCLDVASGTPIIKPCT